MISLDSNNRSERYYHYCHFAAEKTEAQRSWVNCSQTPARKWWFWTQVMWLQLHHSLHSAVLTLVTHHRVSQEHETLGGNSLMWAACGISMCAMGLADGYCCELPTFPHPPGTMCSLWISTEVRISITVTPWEMPYKKQQRKAWQKIYNILEQENIG